MAQTASISQAALWGPACQVICSSRRAEDIKTY